MKAESLRFSSCALPSRAFRLSKSSPAQNALPAPVMMSTCAADFSISSSARSNSSTNSKLMALRLSGRLSVSVVTPCCSETRIVLNDICLRGSKFCRQLHQSRQGFLNRRLNCALRQCFQQNFGRNISHQLVLGKRTSSQPAQRRVKSPAPGIVCRQNFFRRLLPPAVQVYADFSRRAKFGNLRLHQVVDFRRVRKYNVLG